MTQVAMPIVHIAEACYVTVMWLWTHVSVVSLTMTEDTTVPLGAFFVYVISTIFLALAAIMEPLLTLAMSMLHCILIVVLLCYLANGGIIDEGGTDSMMITPCHSSSVAIVGTVVVMSLVTSPYGVINMATIVCGG
jgi:hypothetical protein